MSGIELARLILLMLASVGCLCIYTFFNDELNSNNNDEIYNQFKDCKLLEVAHYNGFWESKTNKLDCNGVIYNVPTSDYDNAMNNH
ncbi:hypothetical protein LBA84_004579 [Salmonella enterica]|nr:hypothetical protein [Salmonella enterica]EID2343477.1 hypothetical protein [Salmonella enterica]